MRQLRRVLLAGCLAALLLAGCRTGGSNAALVGSETSGPNLRPALTLEQADQVAETFLTAWRGSDFPTMYALISPNSRDAFTPEAFVAEYTDFATTLALTGLDFSVASSLRQDTTVSMLYAVTFHSDLFGDLSDAQRVMNLIETPEGWRVAWSRTDILSDLTEGAHLEVERTQPNRGNIYDRQGRVLADQNGRMVALYLVKRDISDANACIMLLARLLNKDSADLQAVFDHFAPETLFFVGNLAPETFQAEQANLLAQCDVGDDTRDTQVLNTRRYIGAEVLGHIVGYVGHITPEQQAEYERRGYSPDAVIGQAGIEQSYESTLAGTIGEKLEVIGADGRVARVIAEKAAAPGQSVYLTIDREMQVAVEQAFEDAYAFAAPTWASSSNGGAAVVMNVKTGEILAMVSYPGFDPGIFNPDSTALDRAEQIAALEEDPRKPLLDRAASGLYPAGSVFKIVSMAAGLDSGVYTEDTGWSCTGSWTYEGFTRTDWYRPGHGWLNFKGGLTNSCDPYFWQLGLTLHNADPTLLEKYAHLMGLGVPTGQTAIAESVGQIPNDEIVFRMNGMHWRVADSLNLVIGQGEILITPLQITRMVAGVANGGTMLKPQFVSKIQLIGDAPVYEVQPEVIQQLDFDPHTFELIREAMCDVTLLPNGTARYIFEPWYKFQENDVVVCGKTGTAQTGGQGVRPQAWFAAFAPQDDPEIAVVVIVENSCEGSEVAAPIVRRIVEDYYHMPHYEWPAFWQSGCFSLGE